MLLELVLILVSSALLVRFWLRDSNQIIQNEDSKPSAKVGFLQSISIQLAFLFNNHVPNYELLTKWHKTVGNFAYIMHPFKNFAMLSISDLTIAKQVMSSATCSDRLPNDHYIHALTSRKPVGLVFGSSAYWKEARKLTMKLLHQLGFYKQENVEKFINFELRDLEEEMLQAVKDGGGKATMTMHHKFEVYALNIVNQVMLGKRFDRDDPLAKKMMAVINDANREFNRELLDPKRSAKSYQEIPIDFVDHFLVEIDRRAHESPRYLTDDNLLATLRDLILAGADTTSTALDHGVLHMSLNPLVQRKVQDEIDEMIGTRQPEYNDRLSMPYTQAVLQEILRLSTPVPGTSRCPMSDMDINGEHIPKESLIGINLYGIHRSPDLWKNPEEFQPDRFLNDSNELKNLDKIVPFGWGNRICVGETVVRISLFLFFVMLMQTFSFQVSKNHPPPSMKNQIGLSRAPLPYYVTVKCRKSK